MLVGGDAGSEGNEFEVQARGSRGSQACIPITHNWETMMRNSKLSRRLRLMNRDGPGEVSLAEGPCAEWRDCRSSSRCVHIL